MPRIHRQATPPLAQEKVQKRPAEKPPQTEALQASPEQRKVLYKPDGSVEYVNTTMPNFIPFEKLSDDLRYLYNPATGSEAFVPVANGKPLPYKWITPEEKVKAIQSRIDELLKSQDPGNISTAVVDQAAMATQLTDIVSLSRTPRDLLCNWLISYAIARPEDSKDLNWQTSRDKIRDNESTLLSQANHANKLLKDIQEARKAGNTEKLRTLTKALDTTALSVEETAKSQAIFFQGQRDAGKAVNAAALTALAPTVAMESVTGTALATTATTAGVNYVNNLSDAQSQNPGLDAIKNGLKHGVISFAGGVLIKGAIQVGKNMFNTGMPSTSLALNETANATSASTTAVAATNETGTLITSPIKTSSGAPVSSPPIKTITTVTSNTKEATAVTVNPKTVSTVTNEVKATTPPISSPPQQTSLPTRVSNKASLDEAEEYARQELTNIVPNYRPYANNTMNEESQTILKAANRINDSIKHVQKQGVKLPPLNVNFDNTLKDVAHFNPKPILSEINIAPEKLLYTPNSNQFFSTDHPFHIGTHELGHAAHYLQLQKAFNYAKDDALSDFATFFNAAGNTTPLPEALKPLIQQKISRYATVNKLEFVAETFTKLSLTKDPIDSKLLKLYEECNGPLVPGRFDPFASVRNYNPIKPSLEDTILNIRQRYSPYGNGP